MAEAIGDIQERQELQRRMWTYAQRGTVLLVAAFAGLFIGYQMWGQAGELKAKVSQLEEKVAMREKERDTLKSQIAMVDRDKKEAEKKLDELRAKCVSGGGAPTTMGGVEIQ